MPKSKATQIKWLPDVAEHNYPAAHCYLSILYDEARVAEVMAKFKSATIVQFKAKDIFRASQLSLLGVSNSHVEKYRQKLLDGKNLSPPLLVRDPQNGKVVI